LITEEAIGVMPGQWRRFATADKWQAFAVNFLEISPGAEVAEDSRKIIFWTTLSR
jgi:hypothetical protein